MSDQSTHELLLATARTVRAMLTYLKEDAPVPQPVADSLLIALDEALTKVRMLDAAPDLFGTLQGLLKAIDAKESTDIWCAMSRGIIDRIEGRS